MRLFIVDTGTTKSVRDERPSEESLPRGSRVIEVAPASEIDDLKNKISELEDKVYHATRKISELEYLEKIQVTS